MDPLTASLLFSTGTSLLGGFLASRQKQKVPSQLLEAIDRVSDPNYYRSTLERIYNTTQSDANVTKSLARNGIRSQFLEGELQENNKTTAEAAVNNGMEGLEGQRMSLLSQLLGQQNNINQFNTQLGASALNSTITGIGQGALALGMNKQNNQMLNQNNEMMNNIMNQNGGNSMMNWMQSGSLGGDFNLDPNTLNFG